MRPIAYNHISLLSNEFTYIDYGIFKVQSVGVGLGFDNIVN